MTLAELYHLHGSLVYNVALQYTQLNERQKTVLILVKIEGVELVEASKIMELSYKGIESLLSRAKQNLKLIIAKSKEDEG